MKKTFSILSTIALVVLGMAVPSCSKIQDIPDTDDSLTFSLSVSRGEGTKALAESGKNLSKTFAENDRIAVVYQMGGVTKVAVSAALQSANIENGGKRGTFSVSLKGTPDADSAMKIIYPSSLANADGSVNYAALASQDGTLNYIAANLDLGLYEGTLSGTTLPTGVALTNPLVIAKFTVKNSVGSADMTADVTQMVISDGTSIYTATLSSAQSNIWVAMNPVTAGTIVLYAAKGKDLYKKTVSNVTLGANKLYPIQVTMAKVEGAVSGFFSTNAKGDKIYFSQGNLQYTQSSSTWSFMENQYSTEGSADFYILGDDYKNQDIVSLFGWGTSGYNHGAVCYQPTSTSKTTENYYAYGNPDYNLYSSDGKADWGYNRISNGGDTQNSGWHTPTATDWDYILGSRSASTLNGVDNARYAKAYLLGSIHGVILFPDHYNHPAGVASPTGINDSGSSYNANQYDSADWAQMEAAGCVFLPAAGERFDTNAFGLSSGANYWSSSSRDGKHAFYIHCDNLSFCYGVDEYKAKEFGYSVRLVRDL